MTRLEVQQQGAVAVVWIDRPGGGPNLLDRGALEELPKVLERLESDPAAEAVVIASRNPHGFVAGADITLFDELQDREATLELVRGSQELFERLARLPQPKVAAIDGPCAGGGLELVLACDYRLASTGPRTSLALPEVQLGLLPALGGTQRLPRLIGLRAGLELLLTGRKVYARQARRMGLVNAAVHPEGLHAAALEAARQLARVAAGGAADPSAGGRRGTRSANPATGRSSGAAAGTSRVLRLLERGAARELVFRRAAEAASRQTRGNYPAPERILEVVRKSFGGPLEAGLRLEAEAFADLLFTPQSQALRHLFFVRGEARKNRTSGSPMPVERIAVVGAGLMGAGIAQVSAHPGGYRVALKDRAFELAVRGKAAAYRGLSERVGKGMTAFERDAAAERLVPVADYDGVAGADLVIEAVLEDLELKREVVREVEAVAGARHLLASNTSSLPIARIAEGAARPEQVVGMHYFSPVPKMPLLEVVRGPVSSDAAVATAVEAGLRQGKAVIVVADAPGFYVNRILAPYLNEAALLLRDGVAVERIDTEMEAAGFPVGPFRLLDNVGLDVAGKVVEVLAPLFARRGVVLDELLAELPAAGIGGRKTGAGFYLYPTPGRRRPNPEIRRRLGSPRKRDVPAGEIAERLLLAMVNEAVHCLDEGIIGSPRDGDAGAVFGLGFPPFLGGPFHYLTASGRSSVAQRLRALQERFGARFEAARGIDGAGGPAE